MARKVNTASEPNFEEALSELELTVKLLEEGNLSLDDALANFEKGIGLSRICSKKLELAEKRIDILCSEGGQPVLKPANLPEERNE